MIMKEWGSARRRCDTSIDIRAFRAHLVGEGAASALVLERENSFYLICGSFVLAIAAFGAYMGNMNGKTILLIVALVVMMGAAMVFSWHVWTSVDGDGGQVMNGNGMAALIIGGIGTLALGGGLMALVFYSSRRGYDDAADFKHTDE